MQNVFSPLTTSALSLKNRLVRSATNDDMGGANGEITMRELSLYRELSQNEVGLIISAHAYCEPNGKASPLQNGLDTDENIEIMRKIAQAIHSDGSRMIMQVSHAGIKAISDAPTSPDSMIDSDFARIEAAFVAACIRTKNANMDGVQIHCAHGYLLSQFINPETNHRTDCYGGSAQNRFRFAAEIIQNVIAECGRDFSVSIKINSNQQTCNDQYELDLLEILKTCAKIGVDFAELSGYNFSSFPSDSAPYYLERAAKMRQSCDLPIALCGGVKNAEHAQALIDSGIDMVSVCRAIIAVPNLAECLRRKTSSPCISCRKCFTQILTNGRACILHEKNSDLTKYST